MTDTPTDTAPEAITQAELRLLIERAERFALFLNTAPEEHGDTIGADRCARCLNSRSAGEGLREKAALFVTDGYRCRNCDAVFVATEGHSEPECDRPNWDALSDDGKAAAIRALDLTPPSDAESTTRSGGEGVRDIVARAYADGATECHTYWRECRPDVVFDREPDFAEAASDYASHIVVLPATTPSPDASPDSGEAEEDALAVAREYADANDWNGAYHAMRCAYDLRANPSPAIVKEAGEVERLIKALQKIATSASGDMAINDTAYVYREFAACKDTARAALSASNAAQVSK